MTKTQYKIRLQHILDMMNQLDADVEASHLDHKDDAVADSVITLSSAIESVETALKEAEDDEFYTEEAKSKRMTVDEYAAMLMGR